jgi:hypothetical protein
VRTRNQENQRENKINAKNTAVDKKLSNTKRKKRVDEMKETKQGKQRQPPTTYGIGT